MVSRKEKADAEREALIEARKVCAGILGATPLRVIREYCNGDVPINGIKFPCANQKSEDGSLCPSQPGCLPSIHFKMEPPKKPPKGKASSTWR